MSETSMPTVTVALPVYNERRFLRAAVESILEQTWQGLKLVVVDDGSIDGSVRTIADIEDPRLSILHQENSGKAVALNRVLDNTRSEFFAIQDADDLSHPTRIQLQVEALLENADVAAVFSGHDLLLGEERLAPRARAYSREQCRAFIDRMRMPAHDPTAMYRRTLISGLRFDPAFFVAQGLDFILRVGEIHPMLVLGECLYSYRINPVSQTRSNVERRAEYVHRACLRACERRGIPVERAVEFYETPKELGSNRIRDNNLAAHFMESVLDLRRAGRRGEAIRTALRCLRLHVLDPHYHKALAFSLLPLSVVARLRRSA